MRMVHFHPECWTFACFHSLLTALSPLLFACARCSSSIKELSPLLFWNDKVLKVINVYEMKMYEMRQFQAIPLEAVLKWACSLAFCRKTSVFTFSTAVPILVFFLKRKIKVCCSSSFSSFLHMDPITSLHQKGKGWNSLKQLVPKGSPDITSTSVVPTLHRVFCFITGSLTATSIYLFRHNN